MFKPNTIKKLIFWLSIHRVHCLSLQIYLLNEEQRVKIILQGEPDEVGEFKDIFAEFLTYTTGSIINVDKIRTHMNVAGKPDPSKTDMFIHAIDPATSEVLDAKVLIE